METHQPHLVHFPGLQLVAFDLVSNGGAEAVHALVPPALGSGLYLSCHGVGRGITYKKREETKWVNGKEIEKIYTEVKAKFQ